MSKRKLVNNTQKKEIILIISSFIIGGIVTLSLIKFTPLIDNIIPTNAIIKNKTQVYEKTSLASSIDKIYDAVVVVQVYDSDSIENSGTGFVYRTDDNYGYILTNEHVLSDSNSVKVLFTSDEEVEAKVLGKDTYLDLAVLRVDKKFVSLISTIASSEEMNLGDTVFTVGSPLGSTYRGSVTSGVLSGKDRMVSISVDNSTDNDWIMRVLQIDASINPGNSGGPLLNVNGEVIGICSMKLVDDNIEGMGFAIPIEYAMSHVNSLENGKKIKWPVLGIGMINPTDAANLVRNNLSVDKNIKEGVVVQSIKEGSAAAKSNLKKGDIIIKIDKNKVKDIAHLKYELYTNKVGDTIEVTYLRKGIEKKTKVTLRES